MYCTSDTRINADFVRRAIRANVPVLVVTIDVPVNANRERNRRNGFSRPFRMTPSVVLEALGHPAWVLRYLRTGGVPMMRNWQPYAPEGANAAQVADMFGALTPAPMVCWDHLHRIREAWSGPLVIKGLLHPDDALEAVRLGADGLVVSNHGGRQLDAAPSPLEVLPAIRAAVGERVTLILDSGVRRGSDVVIARCLGANAAVFGRSSGSCACIADHAQRDRHGARANRLRGVQYARRAIPMERRARSAGTAVRTRGNRARHRHSETR
jgi:L-lactate dehydrogenase (cytochrome)/(S)-mandelate dehydrogenase